MGSLNASGVPVVDAYTKSNYTYRKMDVDIIRENSIDDSESVLVDTQQARAIGSGSIVREGSVEYYEELVYGTTLGGRTAQARIASETGVARTNVDIGDNKTDAVIPTYLQPSGSQDSAKHTGSRIQIANSVGDALSRVSDSGTYGF